MSVLRRKKTKQAQATDWLTTVLRLGAVGAAAKGAKKTAAKGAKKGSKKVAAKGGKGAGKRLAPFMVIGTVAFVAVRKLRGKKDAQQFPAAAAPTPAAPPEPASTRP